MEYLHKYIAHCMLHRVINGQNAHTLLETSQDSSFMSGSYLYIFAVRTSYLYLSQLCGHLPIIRISNHEKIWHLN